jgi:hypothetical protein
MGNERHRSYTVLPVLVVIAMSGNPKTREQLQHPARKQQQKNGESKRFERATKQAPRRFSRRKV